jgi:hypothetical protein
MIKLPIGHFYLADRIANNAIESTKYAANIVK